MEILDIIKSRRSIRQYLDKDISGDLIREIIEAARFAPSGLNNQPWRFIIVKDKKLKDKTAGLTKYCAIIKNAPVIICVFLNYGDSYNRDKDIMAIGACIQNMLLAGHGMGLAACWLGEILNQKQGVSKLLEVDEDHELMAVITIGYADEKPGKGERRPIKDLVMKEI